MFERATELNPDYADAAENLADVRRLVTSRHEHHHHRIVRNYLGQIRVLARTFTATNPGCRCLVYFIDEVPEGLDLSAELFEVLPTEALPISQRELHLMATIYDVTEYATSVKPWVLEAAMEVTGGPICYIDPDIVLYRELEPHVALGLERHGVVLTPHLRAPMPRDGKMLR